MALKPSDLETRVQTSVMREALDENLRSIDSFLRQRDLRWGRNVFEYNIPSVTIPGLAKAETQRYLYSGIIESLTKRGFSVGIALETSVLYIALNVTFDEKKLREMTDTIEKVRLFNATDIEEFRRTGKNAGVNPK